jgi:hypothetical protein
MSVDQTVAASIPLFQWSGFDIRYPTSARFPKFVIHGSTLAHELRKAKGHRPLYGSSAAFDLKFLNVRAATYAGTSNRRH